MIFFGLFGTIFPNLCYIQFVGSSTKPYFFQKSETKFSEIFRNNGETIEKPIVNEESFGCLFQ